MCLELLLCPGRTPIHPARPSSKVFFKVVWQARLLLSCPPTLYGLDMWSCLGLCPGPSPLGTVSALYRAPSTMSTGQDKTTGSHMISESFLGSSLFRASLGAHPQASGIRICSMPAGSQLPTRALLVHFWASGQQCSWRKTAPQAGCLSGSQAPSGTWVMPEA